MAKYTKCYECGKDTHHIDLEWVPQWNLCPECGQRSADRSQRIMDNMSQFRRPNNG